MMLTKLNRKYRSKDDEIGTLINSSIVSTIPLLLSFLLHNNYLLYIVPVIFISGIVILNAMIDSEHRMKIEKNEKDLIELKKIVDSKKLSSKSSHFHIEKREEENHVWYGIKGFTSYPPVVNFQYDKEKKNVYGWYYHEEDINKYFKRKGNEILESLKCMILESENRRGTMIEHLELIEEGVKNQDEILQKIQDLITQSCAIAQSNETLLSIEDKHALVSSIPSDAKELKDVYLSFSDESKESNKEYIKETLSVLEKRIISISTNMEKMKQEKLHVIKEKILKKHSL